jgi:hypothetical protein
VSNIIRITSGDAYTGDRRLTVTVTEANGDAVDLTDVALVFMAKRHRSDEDAAITKTTSDDIEITDATGGIARIALAEDDTDDMAGKYTWELEATDSEGKLTLAAGNLYVTRDLIEG